MPVLLSWLLSAFGSLVGYSVVRFTAMKLFLWVLMITVVPVLFSRVIYMLIEGVMGTMNNIDSAYGINSTVISLTGVAAWLASPLKVV